MSMMKKNITVTDEKEIEYIREKLILAEEKLEKKGYSKRSVTDIMKDILKRKGIDTKL